jgi:hypothetical protein
MAELKSKPTRKQIDAMLDLTKLTPELVKMILNPQPITQTQTKSKVQK